MKNFSEKLKKALKEKGITQGRLCKEIGMTDSGFIRMIDNNNIKVDTLEQICKVLDIPVTYFLDIEIKPEGFWERMMNDMSEEIKALRMRAYRAEDQLNKLGVGNFNYVSRRQGVLASVA